MAQLGCTMAIVVLIYVPLCGKEGLRIGIEVAEV